LFIPKLVVPLHRSNKCNSYLLQIHIIYDISVKVSYSSNTIQQIALALVWTAPTHGYLIFIHYVQTRNQPRCGE